MMYHLVKMEDISKEFTTLDNVVTEEQDSDLKNYIINYQPFFILIILWEILFLFLEIISISWNEICGLPHNGKASLLLISSFAIEPYLKLHALV